MSNEWYTPSKYIEAARSVMGSIDLDPASCALANQTVRAARYYTQEDDGLSKAWYGNVWLNPPFRTPGMARRARVSCMSLFVNKLLDEYLDGRVSQAILLTTSKAEARWFQPLWDYPVCFANHHVMFNLPSPIPKTSKHSPGRNVDGHIWGTCFIYLGANEQRFIDVFSQFGRIAKAVDVPVAKPRQLELVS